MGNQLSAVEWPEEEHNVLGGVRAHDQDQTTGQNMILLRQHMPHGVPRFNTACTDTRVDEGWHRRVVSRFG